MPDMRDYSEDHPAIAKMTEKLGFENNGAKLLKKVDLGE